MSDFLYVFSYWLSSSYPTAPADIEVSINGVQISIDPAPGTSGNWVKYAHSWYSGSATQADIVLKDLTRAYSGDDFAIDDICFYTDTISVDIDIKPGSYPNCFNLNGKGVIPVAILGSSDFDVTDIVIDETLNFAGLAVRVRGKKGPLCHYEDVSGDFAYPEGAPDGYIDLVCQFEDDPVFWDAGNSSAVVKGYLSDKTPFRGSDEICITQPLPE